MNDRVNRLEQCEDHWETELGGSLLGERVVARGKDLFTEFNHYSWHKYLLLMITGREFSDKDIEFLDKFWMLAISYPDPRIWSNRIGALAGTVRSTAHLGISAGCAGAEARIFGGQALIAAADFIVKCAKKVKKGCELEKIVYSELKNGKSIYGFGRPVSRKDERIKPLEELMEKYDYCQGKHVLLVYRINEILKKGGCSMQMNAGGLIAAIGADLGLSAYEFYLWLVNGFNAGTTACYLDALNKQEGTLFPLRCERIYYQGMPKRKWD